MCTNCYFLASNQNFIFFIFVFIATRFMVNKVIQNSAIAIRFSDIDFLKENNNLALSRCDLDR